MISASSNIYLKTLVCLLVFIVSGNLFSQVGIGNLNPNTSLDINGSLAIREGNEISVNDGNNNSINLGSTIYSNFRLIGATSVFSINGIVPLTGIDGQIITLQNDCTQSAGNEIMYIAHNSSVEPTASNRILVPGGKDLMLRGRYATVTLRYSQSDSRWVVLNNFNHVETWYTSFSITNNTIATVTLTNQGISPTTGIAMNLCNVTGLSETVKNNIQIEYIEAQTNQFKFRIRNSNGGMPRSLVYAITIYK